MVGCVSRVKEGLPPHPPDPRHQSTFQDIFLAELSIQLCKDPGVGLVPDSRGRQLRAESCASVDWRMEPAAASQGIRSYSLSCLGIYRWSPEVSGTVCQRKSDLGVTVAMARFGAIVKVCRYLI